MMLTPQLVESHEQAASYYVRRREPGWTGVDERELNAWLDSHPAHRSIYDGLAHTAFDLKQIRRPRLASDLPAATAVSQHSELGTPSDRRSAPVPMSAAPANFNPWRRVFAPAVLSVALLAAGGGWYWWDTNPSYTLDMATGPGETREVKLPDGSSVTVNFSSTLQVRYYPRRRETVLNTGEAFFRVAADTAKPFTVDSGNTQIRVVGTAFNVRAAPPRLVVKVLEGKVQVHLDRNRPNDNTLLLGAGAGIGIDPVDGQYVSVPAGAETVGDWRMGQLVFQQTPLAEVASELSRYLGQPVRLDGNERLASLPVSGMVVTTAPRAFLMSLPHLLPVLVKAAPEGGWRISPS